MASEYRLVRVGGREIRLSNLDKVLYPSTGTTKADVIAYYSEIAPTMLPHCRDRAATRKRWPDGVGADGTGDFFFQRDLGDSAPGWVATGSIQHKDHVNVYPLVNDEATLVWLAQLAALEIHVPQWRFDARGEPLAPDRLVLDLDPGPGVSLRECADVAFAVRRLLTGMGLTAVPVTSGSKGIHLYAALDGRQTSEQVSRVARELARSLEADHPDEITSSMQKSLRAGKVFIDWSQNSASKTTVAPYSLRGRAAPFVAAPRSWRELASPHLRQLDFREVLKRVARRGDPMLPLAPTAAQRTHERLEPYRGKRDARRTPEPVPGRGDDLEANEDPAAPRFVIQRHDARRPHFDFRLEHDGVLVSWALPKGVPTDPAKNRLAVPTEDHPMEYRHFEGTIPRGEYGAGEVRIWDEGGYELEKWRDDEVIVALTGRPGGGLGGTRRFALFRTSADPEKAAWMIHLMEPEEPGPDPGRDREPGRDRSGGRDPDPAPRRSARARARGRGAPRSARSASHALPDPPAPMLATRGTAAALGHLDPEEWAFEMKWDGMRVLAAVTAAPGGAGSEDGPSDSAAVGGAADGGVAVLLRSRSGADVTASYPELQALADAVNAEEAVLDGEIVALAPGGVPSFGRLQERMGLTGEREVARARRGAPVTLFAFDLLELEGRDCRGLSYRQRRELLAEVLEDHAGAAVALPAAVEGDAEHAIATSRRLGLEGIVAKRRDSRYRSGIRSADWLKFPLFETAEVVVIGWRESEADPSGLASLLLAGRVDGELRYAGRVGTGFSAAERRDIRRRLAGRRQSSAATEVPAEVRRDARWVEPELVGEVSFGGRTAEGRLRHAVWRGWRPDKTVDEL
ncbi:ATP-dependent DNA ligase [Leucobacter sp.]